MGKGALAADCTSYECQVSTHGQPLSAAGADFGQTIKNLGGDAESPFSIFPEVAELYQKRKEELKVIVAERMPNCNSGQLPTLGWLRRNANGSPVNCLQLTGVPSLRRLTVPRVPPLPQYSRSWLNRWKT